MPSFTVNAIPLLGIISVILAIITLTFAYKTKNPAIEPFFVFGGLLLAGASIWCIIPSFFTIPDSAREHQFSLTYTLDGKLCQAESRIGYNGFIHTRTKVKVPGEFTQTMRFKKENAVVKIKAKIKIIYSFHRINEIFKNTKTTPEQYRKQYISILNKTFRKVISQGNFIEKRVNSFQETIAMRWQKAAAQEMLLKCGIIIKKITIKKINS